jgi:hypothetical protein
MLIRKLHIQGAPLSRAAVLAASPPPGEYAGQEARKIAGLEALLIHA